MTHDLAQQLRVKTGLPWEQAGNDYRVHVPASRADAWLTTLTALNLRAAFLGPNPNEDERRQAAAAAVVIRRENDVHDYSRLAIDPQTAQTILETYQAAARDTSRPAAGQAR